MSSINTNISAYYAQNNLRAANAQAQASIARLSSGNKIVSASDDVAGLSIGTILRTTVSTLRTAATNASQGSTLLQVADGALSSLGEILQRQKSLAVQANSGTLSDNERSYLNQEFQSLKLEYDRIVSKTNFNGVTLLDGNLAANTKTIATERPAGTANFTNVLLDSDSSINTSILTNGLTSLTVATVGTSDRALNAYQGSLANAKVSVVHTGTTDDASMTLEINGVLFKSSYNGLQTNAATSDIALTQVLTAEESAASVTAMVLNIDVTLALGATADAADAQAAAQSIEAEVRKMGVYQDRALESTAATDPTAITTAKFAGTVLQGMSGADFSIHGNSFDSSTGFAPSISNFKVKSISSTLASFEVTINGTTYSSAKTAGLENGVTVDGSIEGNDLDGTGGSGTGVLRLTSADDANAYIDIDLASNTPGNISLVNADEATGLAAALNGAFGSGVSGGLSFQVGTDSADKISIGINSVKSNSVYKNSDGETKSLDISTQAGAIEASDVLDIAIKTITSTRADVGALQSRFSYASATLSTSIQNLDAARGQFLDTDVSAESTRFATQQVLQQAAISVLAQANQIPQNLLKLIG